MAKEPMSTADVMKDLPVMDAKDPAAAAPEAPAAEAAPAPFAPAPASAATPGSGLPVAVDSVVAQKGGVFKVPNTGITIRTS
ncbi:MAG: hypothetical protein ACXWDH_06390 [Aeromicrobium sp.]